MHYYYDVLVNLDETLWNFYEWENTDYLLPIKKIPIIRVSNETILDFMKYQVSFDKEWLELYKDKTIFKNKKEKGTLILFSSTKNCIVLEINEFGYSIYRSKLLIEDEINCNEQAYSFRETKVCYEKRKIIDFNLEFRKAIEEKRLLKTEIKTMEEQHNYEKCSYLYFEWFGVLENDFTLMIEKMKKELNKPFSLKMYEITKLIKLSYKESL